MTEQILYVESKGAGTDEENTKANGLWIRLSRWEPDVRAFPSLPSHYLIECRVMIDREFVRDSVNIHVENWSNKDAEYIRKVIDIMDNLVALYPQVVGNLEVVEE